jgi:DNA-binding FadR family transcriptional regulator
MSSREGGATRAGRWRRGQAQRLVFDWLMERIQGMHFAPGTRIPTEPQLGAELGVSRSAVRDAVQRLVAMGVLEIRPGIGTFVRALSAGSALTAADTARRLAPVGVLDLLELRRILESAIVRLAA